MPEAKITNATSKYNMIGNNPYQGLLHLAVPLIIAFSIQTGFNVVDAIYVGRISSDAIAAISIAYPVQMVLMAIGGGLGIGAQSLIARSIGADNHQNANDSASQGIALSFILGLVSIFVGMILLPLVIPSIGASMPVTSLAMEYLDIIILGAPLVFLILMVDSILRGEGNTKRAMIYLGFSAILNIFLDPLFIFTFGYGVSGAAIATVLSRLIALAFAMHYVLLSPKMSIHITFSGFIFKINTIKNIVNVGIPASLSQLSYSVSLFIMNSILATYGSDVIAAFGIGFRIESVAFLPMFGLAGAFVSVVGYLYGAKKIHLLYNLKTKAYLTLIIYMSICAVCFFISPKYLYKAFTDSSSVIDMGRLYLRINVLAYPLVPLSILSASGFQGIGKGIPPMMLAFLRSWLIVIPASLFVSQVLGAPVIYVWWIMTISNIIAAITGYVWYSRTLKAIRQ